MERLNDYHYHYQQCTTHGREFCLDDDCRMQRNRALEAHPDTDRSQTP